MYMYNLNIFFNFKKDKKQPTMAYHLENFFEVYAKMMMSWIRIMVEEIKRTGQMELFNWFLALWSEKMLWYDFNR